MVSFLGAYERGGANRPNDYRLGAHEELHIGQFVLLQRGDTVIQGAICRTPDMATDPRVVPSIEVRGVSTAVGRDIATLEHIQSGEVRLYELSAANIVHAMFEMQPTRLNIASLS